MRIKCSYELANEYREKLEKLGFEIPYPCLIDICPIAFPNPETVTFDFSYDNFDYNRDLKVLKLFIELIEKGAKVEDNVSQVDTSQEDDCEKGELYYRDRNIDPSTFKLGCKDLRRLVGYCRDCGCCLRGRSAIPAPDPFREDVCGDDTPVVQCDSCAKDSAFEI